VFPHLQSAIDIAGYAVRNRVMHASVVTVLSHQSGVTDRLLQYYASRAQGGAGLIVTEPIAMARAQDVPNWVRAWTDDARDGLSRWAQVVESQGCRLLGQLVDRGRGRNVPGRNPDAIGASALPDDLSFTMPRPLKAGEIRAMVDEFSASALRLKQCGFSGTEISAGHGHLLHQFLSPRMNRRDDAYGGDLEGRTRFLRELIDAIRAQCGAHFIIAVKFPGDDGVPGSVDESEAQRIVARVTEGGQVNLVSFAQGSHSQTLELHVPDDHAPRLPYMDQLRRLRPYVRHGAVAALGRITDPAEAEAILARGDAQMIALGRALIADPAWPNKAFQGRSHDIRYCVSCNTCWHRTTALRLPIGCDNNPNVTEPGEADWKPAAAAVQRRVVVVGGGIAGLEAAWTAAARGHALTVLSQAGEPGGKARLRAALPGGESHSSVYDYQLSQAARYGVTVQAGVHATMDDIVRLRPDAVVLATGATMVAPQWLTPALQGLGIVADLRDTLQDLSRIARRQPGTAVVYDMDHTEGTYAAVERLHALFDSVVLVTPRESIARDTSVVTRQGIYRRLSQLGTRLVLLSEISLPGDLEDGVVECVHIYSGLRERIDNLALLTYSTPRRPNDQLLEPLRDAGLEVHTVGDCRNARDVFSATTEGHGAGMAV